ncbi:MAG TPA: Lrp/AsnC family transcriptional regulator [Sedimenticola thiotaurini]|uniref:Lrp/AsnC family transcriptional regulator n=1 Tax=Sedimenticola thiotaurini TaxID=1543721 RepID=A0A831RPM0_9GAMM|nr:Lrp/AsnC family transcriptional regulator [Sedimenticola thiotaurini]
MAATELDRTDRRILNLLQRDGRMTNAELAGRVNLSASACLRRVQRLEQSGVIDRYVLLVRQEAVGKPTSVFVEISLDSQSDESLDAFERAVADCPEIMECFLMAGDSDYLLRLVVADARDYERIHRQHLSRFPHVARIRSNFALRTVCRKTALVL